MMMSFYLRISRLISTLVLASIVYLFSPALIAEDTEIYNELARCMVGDEERYRFIFIVDNSGSMSGWEFTQSRNTINATIKEILNSDLDDVQVAVVQYGTNHFTKRHQYNVTVPFTNKLGQATSWNRYYGPGSPRFWDLQDHQPASLSKMRLDKVYDKGKPLDVSDATNVQFVFFTDAWRDYYRGCCSSLVNTQSPYHGDLSRVLPGFGEYDALKSGSVLPNGLKAQFTILHVPPNSSAGSAAAAIASPGGSYLGDVEVNAGDPEGPGTKPRRYVQGSFSVSDTNRIIELIQQVIFEVKDATYTSVAPSVSVNAFNELQHRNDLFFSVFQPGERPRWNGNVKKFKVRDDGIIVDANNKPAINLKDGSLEENARSFWSDKTDGVDVSLGGYRSQLTNNRIVYTDRTALERGSHSKTPVQISANSKIQLDKLDLAQESTSGLCVLIGERENGVVTVSNQGTTAVSDLPVKIGRARLSFTTTEAVAASVVLNPKRSSASQSFRCNSNYAGGGTVHQCEFSVDSTIKSLDVTFRSLSAESQVDYVLEYNIPTDMTATPCGSVYSQRKDYLKWLMGIDVYNEDKDSSFTDAHQFASDPLHSKSVMVTYSGTNAYDAKEVLFVTDNMGMLHAINPADNRGDVIWSYIPEDHLDNVKKMIINEAGQPKVYGLDGHLSVVQRKAEKSSRRNYAVNDVRLYFGERRGGRNYYSLDVTNATKKNNAPKVDWKIRGGDEGFTDLGQTWSSLQPTRIAYNCNAMRQACKYREVLIFSGGYDPAYDDPNQMPSGTLGNALYIVDLETGGKKFLWSAGNNDDSRDADKHNLHLPITHSIVASPTLIDTNGDGAVDILFAVDISGKTWRIDFNASASRLHKLATTGGMIADLSTPSKYRRFYNPIDVSRTDPRLGSNEFVLAVGSGYRAHPNDMQDTHNALFVLYDANVNAIETTAGSGSSPYHYFKGRRPVLVSDLVDVDNSTDYSAYGMYKRASAAGEKFLQPVLTMNGTIIISSFVPGDNSGASCSLGSGRTYFLNANTLKSTFDKPFAKTGLPGIPPETSILHLPKLAICVGTICATTEDPKKSPESDAADCEPGEFKSGDFSSELSAGFSSLACGMKLRHAFRSGWLEEK